MRYLLIIAFLAAVAGLEFYHALSGDAAHGHIAMPAEGKANAIRDVVFDHARGH